MGPPRLYTFSPCASLLLKTFFCLLLFDVLFFLLFATQIMAIVIASSSSSSSSFFSVPLRRFLSFKISRENNHTSATEKIFVISSELDTMKLSQQQKQQCSLLDSL